MPPFTGTLSTPPKSQSEGKPTTGRNTAVLKPRRGLQNASDVTSVHETPSAELAHDPEGEGLWVEGERESRVRAGVGCVEGLGWGCWGG